MLVYFYIKTQHYIYVLIIMDLLLKETYPKSVDKAMGRCRSVNYLKSKVIVLHTAGTQHVC